MGQENWKTLSQSWFYFPTTLLLEFGVIDYDLYSLIYSHITNNLKAQSPRQLHATLILITSRCDLGRTPPKICGITFPISGDRDD